MARYQSADFQHKLDGTKRQFADFQKYAINVSWGKDSLVMLHLALSVFGRVVALNARYFNAAERFADIDRVRDEFLSRTEAANLCYREVPCPGKWEVYERVGHGFLSAETAEEKSASRWRKANFEANLWAAAQAEGCIGQAIGLCAEESRGRALNFYRRGKSYQKASGVPVYTPLAQWSAKDIWAYMSWHNLPRLKIYDESLQGRERARSGFLFSTTRKDNTLYRYGVWSDWERIYPEAFMAWIDRFPELNRGRI